MSVPSARRTARPDEHRDAHRFEVVAPHEPPTHARHRLRPARGLVVRGAPRSSTSSRSSADGRPRPPPSRPAEPPTRSRTCSRYGRPVVRARYFDGGLQAEGEHAVRIEAGVDALEVPHRAQHQSRADAEHDRQRHLRRHQAAQRALAPGVSVDGVLAQQRLQVRAAAASSAGSSAIATARPTDAASTAASTAPSSAISACRGTSAGCARAAAAAPARARPRPASAPAVASTACSTSSWRQELPRDAPTRRCARPARARARSSGRAPACRGSRRPAAGSGRRPPAARRARAARPGDGVLQRLHAQGPAPVVGPARACRISGRQRRQLARRRRGGRAGAQAREGRGEGLPLNVGVPGAKGSGTHRSVPGRAASKPAASRRSPRAAPDRRARRVRGSPASAPKRWRHNRSESTATRSRPGVPSPGSRVRPSAGRHSEHREQVVRHAGAGDLDAARRRRRPGPSAIPAPRRPPLESRAPGRARRRSRRSRRTRRARPPPARSGRSNGSGRSSTPRTTENTAALAPAPRASSRMAVAAKLGRRARFRIARRRSWSSMALRRGQAPGG